MKLILNLILLLVFICFNASSKDLQRDLKKANFYFLIDANTKEVLLSKNPDIAIPPSSMTKLMTAYVVFDQARKGKISLQNQCLIGRDAWRKSGSSMFLNHGDVVTINELVKGLLAVSGNDAAIALSQAAVKGGSKNFMRLMNKTAKEIGLKNSHFKNPHGLNEKGHKMSMRDLATLMIRFHEDFPEYIPYLGIKKYTYEKVTQYNRNPLIRRKYDGFVGGKTGYTSKGGYGVVGFVKRGHRKLIGVMGKVKSSKSRERAIKALFDYGFDEYKKIDFFEKNQEVVELETWLGSKSKVLAIIKQDVSLNIPREIPLKSIKINVEYDGPIYTPILKDDQIATLIISAKGHKTLKYPLFAKQNIDKARSLNRIRKLLSYKFKNILKD